MKKIMKRIKKVFILLCTIVILASSVDISALALTIQDAPDTIPVIDVEWQCPTQIVSVEMQEKQFIISAKSEKGRIQNLYFSFPADGGVRFHADQTGFFSPAEVSKINYKAEGAAVVMQANGTTVKFYKTAAPWRFEVYNAEGKMVAWYLADDMYFGYDKNGELQKVKIISDVGKYEKLFGLGERFGGLIQNGKTVEMWNFDSFGQLGSQIGDHNVGYKNIPMLHSNHGYTVFHNNTYYGVVDVADTKADQCSFEFYGPILDMYVWTGTAIENIDRYLTLTGSTVTVPKYALSYWAGQSSSMWKSKGKSDNEVISVLQTNLDKYDALNTPIKVVYLEALGNDNAYAGVHKMLKSRNVKWLGWLKSTYNTVDSSFEAADISKQLQWSKSQIPLVKFDYARLSNYWNSASAEQYVDYSNPLGTTWLSTNLKRFMPLGLNGMMVDFNDETTMETYYPYIGKSGDEMHNLSQYFYTKAFHDAFAEVYGEGNFVTIARAGVAGSQAHTASFAGDQTSSFLGLSEVVSALLSSSASGINVWGSDIGGLGSSSDKKKNDPELYARWLQFGTFSPLMRTHGQTSWRDPWAYGDSSEKIFQKYYWTRESIVDLLNSGIIRASVENYPLTQSMIVAYPDQTKLAENESQYLLCDSLLVCPVTESGASTVKVQFPKGRWVSIWDGTVIEGDCEKYVDASLDTIPVYMEAGSAVPMTLGKELKIDGINTEGKNAEVLVVTPAVEKKENRIYLDKETTQVYTCDTLGDNLYSVTKDASVNKKIVVVKGLTANHVKVSNTELKELKERPTSSSGKEGYYRDVENNTTIIVTDGNWTTLEYAGSNEKLANIALGAIVTTEGLSEKHAAKAQNATDGDYLTDLTITKGEKTSVTVDLKDSYKLSKILVKWGSDYARGYKLEVSNSLDENAKWVSVYEKQKGAGGTDTVLVDQEEEYRYIRLSDFDILSKTGAKLVEIEAYGDVVEIMDTVNTEIIVKQEQEKVIPQEISGNFWYITGGAALLILLISVVIAICLRKKGESNETKG